MNNVSVPTFTNAAPSDVEKRRINAAYELIRPIHIIASIMIAAFGTGPDSMPSLPTNTTTVAIKPNTSTSGSAASPLQYAQSGAATQPTTPMIVDGR